VAPEDVEPGVVAETVVQHCRVDDVGEDDRDRAIRGKGARQIGALALDRLLELFEADGQGHA
jgi:hypothetical protein